MLIAIFITLIMIFTFGLLATISSLSRREMPALLIDEPLRRDDPDYRWS